MAYVVVEKDWVYDYTSVFCSYGEEKGLDDFLIGFFLPSGSFYVEIDRDDIVHAWKDVSYLNGGSKP